jgi:hypothetical protein
MGCTTPASAGLANVVCRTRRLSQQSLDSAPDGTAPRRLPTSAKAHAQESLSERSTELPSSDALPVPLHDASRETPDGQMVES